MNTARTSISVIAPVGPALGRAKAALFQPFNLEKWLAIAFCAWLATLGQGGRGGMNFYGWRGEQPIGESIRRGKEWVLRNLDWLVPVAVGAGVVCLALWVLLTWLSSRGRFMFLYCVASDCGAVAHPWGTYAKQADSLFFFRLILGVLGVVGILPLLVIGALQLADLGKSGDGRLLVMLRLVAVGVFLVIMLVVFGVVGKLTTDFVVPLMFLGTARCLSAWNQFFELCSAHAGWFILYLLFQIVLKAAIALLVLVTVVLTCCLAGCLLLIPYVGTVLLLPILVFERSYSLCFLGQFGAAYDVFTAQAQARASADGNLA